MNKNCARIKSLLQTKFLETEGVERIRLATEGTVFSPSESTGFWFRESYSGWMTEYPADGIERIKGSVSYEIYLPSADGLMSDADSLCDRAASLFDPMNGSFGDAEFRIQPYSIQKIDTSNDGTWLSTGIKILFFACSAQE